METPSLNRTLLQRLFGIPATHTPEDAGCWSYRDGVLTVERSRVPELAAPGRGLRLEGRALPEPVLVLHGVDGRYHAFRNRCTHGGRLLDPVPGAPLLQCCSVGRSTFDYEGHRHEGPAAECLVVYPVRVEAERLYIDIPPAAAPGLLDDVLAGEIL